MKLKFCIEYQTIFGQELVLNIVEGQKQGVLSFSSYRMQTSDGLHWEYVLNRIPKTKKSIDYYYSVERGDQQERREWGVVTHKLELNNKSAVNVCTFDHWNDVPEEDIGSFKVEQKNGDGTYTKLADAWHWSRPTVQKFIEELDSIAVIKRRKSGNAFIFTLNMSTDNRIVI